MKYQPIFQSEYISAILIESDETQSPQKILDYNPLPSISFPLNSYFRYKISRTENLLHAGKILFEKGKICYEIRKPENATDRTLSLLINEENFVLPIPPNKVINLMSRPAKINILINGLLSESSDIAKETLCFELIENAITNDWQWIKDFSTLNINQIDGAKHFIESNYSRDISLADIAATACMSPFHFIRTFKRMTNYSPYQYLMTYRLEKSKSLLASGLNILDIAYQVGFNSLENFSYSFKKYTSISPTKFRRNTLNSDDESTA